MDFQASLRGSQEIVQTGVEGGIGPGGSVSHAQPLLCWPLLSAAPILVSAPGPRGDTSERG